MHEEVLLGHSLEILSKLATDSSSQLAGWILAGGTGLAFRLGHRISEDLVFFRTDNMDVRGPHAIIMP